MRRPSGRHLLRFAAWALLVGGMVWLRFAMARGGFRNADDASNMLAGVEMAEGNWRLRHWVLATDNYYPTDVLAQAVLFKLFGFHPVMMPFAEGAIWAGIAVLGLRLALQDAPARSRPGVAAIVLSLLAFNMFEYQFRDSFLTSIASHGFTILLTLVAFSLLVGRPGRRPVLRLAALCAVSIIGSVSDPIFNIAACLPILAVCLLGLRLRGAQPGAGWRASAWPIAAVVGAMLAARLLLALNQYGGGFQPLGLSVTLATIPQLGGNLLFAVEALARLLGAEFTGATIDGRVSGIVLIHLLRLPFLLGFLAAMVVVGGTIVRDIAAWPCGAIHARAGASDRLLWFSLVSSMAATVLTTVIVDPTCARFFLPAMVTGSILTARILGRVPLASLYGLLLLPISAGATWWSLARIPPGTGLAIPEETRLVEALLAHDLRRGYAGFWEANITTVLSSRAITSLPLLGGGDGLLHPLIWFDNLDWFDRAARDWDGRIFFVVSRRPSGLELGRDMVVHQFGPPAATLDLELYSVLVYDLSRGRLGTLVP